MKLKINYQYTYFIQPYVIKENRYNKYLLKLLKDPNCRLHIFQKDKELELYKYFLPKVRDYMFKTFEYNKNKIRKFEEYNEETKSNLLSEHSCTIFDYELKRDIHGKAESKNSIFFKINKIQIICFKTGICFLCIKTHIEDSSDFSDILNFNYKFRDIKQENDSLNNFDKIKIQTDQYTNIKDFLNFLEEITGANEDAKDLDISEERFFTFSYSCIDQENWNNFTNMDELKTDFIKYVNLLPSDNCENLNEDEMELISKWKYAKLGITKMSCMLFSSSSDINNYTVLPHNFENQYLYTYILNIYEKLCLKKISKELAQNSDYSKFINFNKKIWIQEITNEDLGSLLNQKLRQTLETESIFEQIKNKYDIMYKSLNIEKDKKVTIILSIVLVISLIFNIVNFVLLAKG